MGRSEKGLEDGMKKLRIFEWRIEGEGDPVFFAILRNSFISKIHNEKETTIQLPDTLRFDPC
jgi:hypothetical protein